MIYLFVNGYQNTRGHMIYLLLVIVAQSLVFCVVAFVPYFIMRHMAIAFLSDFHFTEARRGRDRMIVGFTTTYAISAYYHWCCEFESRSGRCEQQYVIKFVSDLRHVGGFLRVLRFPPPIKLTATI